mmetsp:Transcript_12740/g.18794  ORF Transcript_12740/g.18794 Transcript_12740/m.18794 type:complete len:220 (+) Transcript_12740:133-792(+)
MTPVTREVRTQVVPNELAGTGHLSIGPVHHTVAHVGHGGGELRAVELWAVWHGMAQVATPSPGLQRVFLKVRAVAVQGGVAQACGHPLGIGKGGQVQDDPYRAQGLHCIGHPVRQHQPPLGVRVVDLDRLPALHVQHVVGAGGVPAHAVLRDAEHAVQGAAQGRAPPLLLVLGPLHSSPEGTQNCGSSPQIHLHTRHSCLPFDREAASVICDSLAGPNH